MQSKLYGTIGDLRRTASFITTKYWSPSVFTGEQIKEEDDYRSEVTCDCATAVDNQHLQLTLAVCQQRQKLVIHLGALVQLDVAQGRAEQVVADLGEVALVQHVMVGQALDQALLVQGGEAGAKLRNGAQVLLDTTQAQVAQSFHHGELKGVCGSPTGVLCQFH